MFKVLCSSKKLFSLVGVAITVTLLASLLGTSATQASSAVPLYLTFEADDAIGALAAGYNGDKPTGGYSGAVAEIGMPPAGGEASGQALKLNMSGAGEWAGVIVIANSEFDLLKPTTVVTFDYYNPESQATEVNLKIEEAGYPTPSTEMHQFAEPGWNHMVFDMSTAWSYDASENYHWLTLQPNSPKGSVTNSGNSNYWVDNLSVNGGAPSVSPGNSASPSISGAAKVGKTLTAKKGTWIGSPAPTLTYKWYACSKKGSQAVASTPSDCKVISGETSKTLKLKAAQKGKYIRVAVKGTNTSGSKTKFSKSTSIVK